MGKEVIVAFVMMIAWIFVFLWVARTILESVAVFVYFFVKDNAETTTETLSGLITASAGTPGEVKIIFTRPSLDYQYIAYFDKKIVFVSAQYVGKQSYFNLEDELKSWISFLPSSSGVEFEPQEEQIENFLTISINKTYDNGLKINVGE